MQVFGNSGDGWTAAMRGGDLAGAWRISDAALAARDPATRDDPGLPYHLRWVWDGTPLAGRDVLVRCYHGLGDTIQFSRYLAPLRARAARVTLEVQPELLALLRGAADRVAAFDVAHPLPAAEVDVEIMELAHALRLAPDGLAPPVARPAPIRTGAVAVCWETGGWGAGRSVPLPELLDALCGGPLTPALSQREREKALLPLPLGEGRGEGAGAAALLSLQRGAAARDATAPAFLNPRDDDRDIGRTAALIAGARLVVTVDTMVAHLAGALDAATLVLLVHQADWRWGDGESTPWYPSLRLLRQHAPGDWSRPLAEIRRRAAG